jgi:hypothetical protein
VVVRREAIDTGDLRLRDEPNDSDVHDSSPAEQRESATPAANDDRLKSGLPACRKSEREDDRG